MLVSIQETVVTPAKSGLTVQLYISDKPRNDESAAMRLALTATIPHQKSAPLLVQVQRAALAVVRDEIGGLLQNLQTEIQKAER